MKTPKYLIRDNGAYFVRFVSFVDTAWTMEKKEALLCTDKTEIDNILEELTRRGYHPVLEAW